MFGRLLRFAGLPLLSLLTPFLFLPILARFAGADAWVAIAVGQSVGTFFAIVVSQGYNLVGPTAVQLVPQEERPALLGLSIRARFVVFVPCAIAGFFISWAVAPDGFRVVAGLMSLAITTTGLSAVWYMIGLGRVTSLIVFDILPKMAATAIAALVVVTTGQVLWYPVLLFVVAVGMLLFYSIRAMGFDELMRFRIGELRDTLVANRSAFATEVASAAYGTLAVTFVTATTTSAQSAAYISGDKLFKIGQTVIGEAGNALQGWIVERGKDAVRARSKASLLLHSGIGLVGLATFAFAAPALSGFLFGEVVATSQLTALGLGVATLAVSMNTSLARHSLLPLGARRDVLVAVVAGAIVGIPTVLVLSAEFGADGGAWGLAIGEAIVSVVLAACVWLRWSQYDRAMLAVDRPEGD